MARPTVSLAMPEADFKELAKLVSAHSAPQQTVIRCRVALMSREGLKGEEIAKTLGISRSEEKLTDVVGLYLNPPEKAIDEFMQAWNGDPKSFTWTAQAAPIIEKLRRARAALAPSPPRRLRKKKRAAI